MIDVETDLSLVVQGRTMLTPDIVLLELVSASGVTLPPWSPGAHMEMQLGNGLSRQYSLCGDTSDRTVWKVAVLRERESRGGSAYVHDDLHEGEKVQCRGPRNNFTLEDADEFTFVAGGIGITPMLPMIAVVEASGKPWTLLYGGRSRESMAFLDDLTQYGDRVTIHPQDTHGLLDLMGTLSNPRQRAGVYCCGPEPLLDAIERTCESRWPDGSLHVERFRGEAPDLSDARPIDVELVQSGRTIVVPADRTILSVLTDEGIEVDASCEEGTCGTCEVAVLGGVPEHKDSVLTDGEREAGDVMLLCVSRARGTCLKLDL